MSTAGIPNLTLSDDDLLRVRMHALGLGAAAPGPVSSPTDRATSPTDPVVEVVDHLFALQAQDWRASQWAVGVRAGARVPGLSARDVAAAVNDGRIVRSWPMRGTIHLTRAEDIGWMQRLTNARVLKDAPKRRDFLGMSDAVLEQVTDVSVAALTGSAGLTRDELSTVWTEAGIDWQPNWRYHLIWWLSQTGLTTFGPVPGLADESGKPHAAASLEPRLVLASEWIAKPRVFSGDGALLEFTTRYIRGRGAVTQKDLAAWAMLPAADAKRGLTLAAESGAVVQGRRDGVAGAAGALWVDHATLSEATTLPRVQGPSWHLLPAFDEHLLGYTLRDPQLSAEHLPRIIPGKNGVFLPTIVRDGRVVATWRRDPKTAALTISAFPGEPVDVDALRPEIARWAVFTGDDVTAVTLD